METRNVFKLPTAKFKVDRRDGEVNPLRGLYVTVQEAGLATTISWKLARRLNTSWPNRIISIVPYLAKIIEEFDSQNVVLWRCDPRYRLLCLFNLQATSDNLFSTSYHETSPFTVQDPFVLIRIICFISGKVTFVVV